MMLAQFGAPSAVADDVLVRCWREPRPEAVGAPARTRGVTHAIMNEDKIAWTDDHKPHSRRSGSAFLAWVAIAVRYVRSPDEPQPNEEARLGSWPREALSSSEHAPHCNLLEDDNLVRVKKVAPDRYAPCSRERPAKNSRNAFAPAPSAPCLEWLLPRSRTGSGWPSR
jgi:hypothetical protein